VGHSDCLKKKIVPLKSKNRVLAGWNIQGLKNKLGTKEFKEYIRNVDILGIAKTWMTTKDKNKVNGFKYITIKGKKEKI
jgi:hypothetical protein